MPMSIALVMISFAPGIFAARTIDFVNRCLAFD
jgi:hypothetical protein